MRRALAVISVAAASLLSACGGGGGGGGSPTAAIPPATPPTVNNNQNTLLTSVPAFTFTNPDTQAAYNLVQAARGQCGFGLYAYNANLETSAINHANFVATNTPAHPDAYGHIENPAYPGFTGGTPTDRSLFSGYGANPTGEVFGAAFGASTTPRTDVAKLLLNTAYHMAILIDSGTYDIGIGQSSARLDGFQLVVFDVGNKTSVYQDIGPQDIATYPCAALPLSLSAVEGVNTETPNPLPGRDYNAHPVGQPILVAVKHGQTIAISSFTVTGPSGPVAAAAVLTGTTDPNHELGVSQAVFIPDGVFAPNVTYSVAVAGTNNGTPFTKNFTFSTIP